MQDLISIYKENVDFRRAVNNIIRWDLTREIPSDLEINIHKGLLENISTENKDEVFITFGATEVLFKEFIYNYHITMNLYNYHNTTYPFLDMEDESTINVIKEGVITSLIVEYYYLTLFNQNMVNAEFENILDNQTKIGILFVEELRDKLGGNQEFYNVVGVTFEEAINIEKK